MKKILLSIILFSLLVIPVVANADFNGQYSMKLETAKKTCAGVPIGESCEGKIEITTGSDGQMWAKLSCPIIASPRLLAYPNRVSNTGLTALSKNEFKFGSMRSVLQLDPQGPDKYSIDFTSFILMKGNKNEEKQLGVCETRFKGTATLLKNGQEGL